MVYDAGVLYFPGVARPSCSVSQAAYRAFVGFMWVCLDYIEFV